MGRPKGFLEIDGRPVLRYLLHRIVWPGPKILITAPGVEHPPGSEAFDREFIDPEEGAGPLRGVLTALENLQSPLLVIATVDMPEMTAELFTALLDHLTGTPSFQGVMYRRTHDSRSIIEPFPLALRREALPPVRSRYDSSQRSVHHLLDAPGFTTLPAPDAPNVWTNLNTPSDLTRWRRLRSAS
jgi:molybdopterin-guanine dinucleotide biosynthesis protein A